jgi:Arc/MetJ-type ribon-helix-helix transcriptional regulator
VETGSTTTVKQVEREAKAKLVFAVPLHLKAELAAVAQGENISASEFIRRAVRKALDDRREKE